MRRLLLALLVLPLLALGARAERLISDISNETVEITSSFTGERMTFFGSIAPEAGSGQRFVEGPFNVAIVVLGPVGSYRETLDWYVGEMRRHVFG